jgi:hypothetical protein
MIICLQKMTPILKHVISPESMAILMKESIFHIFFVLVLLTVNTHSINKLTIFIHVSRQLVSGTCAHHQEDFT